MPTTIDASAPASSLLGEAYLTDKQTAKGIGISSRTLARLHVKRLGPLRVRVGKKILYKRETVLQWLSEQEEAPRSQRRKKTA